MNVSITRGDRPSVESMITKYTKNTGSKTMLLAALLPYFCREKDKKISLEYAKLVIDSYTEFESQILAQKGSEPKKELMVMAQYTFKNIIRCICDDLTTEFIVSKMLTMLEITANVNE